MLFIFDMGGVMIDNIDVPSRVMKKFGLSPEKFFDYCKKAGMENVPPVNTTLEIASKNPYMSGALSDFERGFIDGKTFWENFERVSGLKAETDYWRFYFRPIDIKGMKELVYELRKTARVVCGTNTTPSHYAVHIERGDYICFDKVYASNLMHIMKPDLAFWKFILDMEEEKPEDTLFFDDSEDNVAMAKSMGIKAHLFKNVEGAKQFITQTTGIDL